MDALRDMDDALTLVHLFASLPAEGRYGIPADAVEKCRRLALEWQAYCARTGALRKTFISVKGFFYQVGGCLWLSCVCGGRGARMLVCLCLDVCAWDGHLVLLRALLGAGWSLHADTLPPTRARPQAEVHGQVVTWLVPHGLAQVLPPDVDYRVMLTFLDFYTTLLRFVMFKLYHGLGLRCVWICVCVCVCIWGWGKCMCVCVWGGGDDWLATAGVLS